MNCWSHRPRSSRTSHSIDKPLFIRWWPGLFVFTIWSATELKKYILGRAHIWTPPISIPWLRPCVRAFRSSNLDGKIVQYDRVCSLIHYISPYSSLQCHMIFRNHSNMLTCCSRNISDYYQCWKQCGNNDLISLGSQNSHHKHRWLTFLNPPSLHLCCLL